ncbi:tape measure protein [Streptococcus suis]|uniref:tape measure protein n=1 Tax=Streptococcus suis TaxID=1307 RepID=UPI003D30091F
MAGKVGSVFKSVLGANLVSSAITSGIGALTSGIGGMVSELNSSQKAWKTFEGNLQAFGRSPEIIAAAKTEMQDFATKTIYSASDMASTYSQLDAVGTKNVGSLVKAFGGLAASAENPAQAMKSLSTQATQMASKPKVAWMDFKIMMEQAPAGMAAVAKEMGMSTAELVSAVQDGKVNTEEFFDAMNRAGNSDAFQKMATEFKTIDQAIDGAKESLSNKLMPTFEHLNKFGIKAVHALSDALEKLNFDKMADSVGKLLDSIDVDGVIGAFGKVGSLAKSFFATVGDTGVFQNLSTTFSLFGDLASSVFNTLLGDAALFGDVAESIGDVFNIVLFTMQDLISGAQSFFASFANTGAIKTVSDAFYDLVKAGLDLSEKLSGVIPWEVIGAATGHVVKFIAQIIQAIANFSQSINGDIWRGVVTGIGGALVAFKAFNFLKSFNPFSFFKKGAGDAVDGVTQSVKRSKSTISQIFNGLSNVIKSVGTAFKSTFQGLGSLFSGLGKTFEGIGKGIGAVLKGLMQGLKGLNPATLLSFGAAVGVAAIGIGAGIAIVAAGFALLASQGEGVAIIVEAVGTAFGTFASMVIGAFADAIVTVAGVLPIIAQSFNMMTPAIIAVGAAISMIIRAFSSLAPVITALGTAISEIVTAITTGVADIVTAVTPMVEILSSAFVQVVTVVSQSIVEIIQALAPFIPAVSEMVQAVAPVLQSMVEAFTTLITNLSPIIDSLTNLVTGLGDSIRNVLDGAKGVIESFGNAVSSILDSVAGVFDSIGNAALNAGKGFNQLAQGIERITKLNLLDMGASLAAVAAGLGAIGATSGGLTSAGSSLNVIVQGLMTVQSVSAIASGSLASLGNVAVSAMSMLVVGVRLAVSGTKSGMSQMVNAISLSANQMIQAGKQAGDGTTKGVVTGIRSGIGQAGGAMHAMMIAIRDTGMQGVSSMRVVGSMISQGLAQGMYSALGDVTAAANALVAQAERAARAKAQIHSPARLFRDRVGIYIGQGVAVGIDKSQKFVDRAMSAMFNGIDNFNAQVNDLMGGNLAYSFDTGRYSSSIEATYRRQDSEEMRVIKEALSTIKELVSRDVVLNVDSHEVARTTGDAMTDYQNDKQQLDNLMWGIR